MIFSESIQIAILSSFFYFSGAEATESASASATSISSCNPLKTSSCTADSALATAISDDFQESTSNYVPYRYPSRISYGSDGVSLTLAERFDNPSLVSDFYIMFGKIEVLLKSANGTGIVSSFYLQSDDLDEIDMEWFGGDASQMQSNFFSKGNTTTYDRGAYHTMADPRAEFHNYTLDWTETSLTWYIDGTAVRTLDSDSPSGYPQSPMRVYFGIWAGGDSTNEIGTIEWAGGATDYSDAPFVMYVKNLVVSDYSSGSEYSYSDQSGSWESITAVDGTINGRKEKAIAEFDALVDGDSASDDASSTSTSTSSSSSSSSSSNPSSSTDASSSLDSSSSSSSSSSTSEPLSTTESSESETSKTASFVETSSTDTVKSSEAIPSTTTDSTSIEDEQSDITSSIDSESTQTDSTNSHTSSTLTTMLSSSSSSKTSSATVDENSNAAGNLKTGISSLFAAILLAFSLI